MKGIVFAVFQKMVEEQDGLKTWDKVVRETDLESGGCYTASATYPDRELSGIVGTFAKLKNLTADAVVRAFGKYMLKALSAKYAVFFRDTTLKPFLVSVDEVIHKEVLKLHPGAELPEFRYEDPGEGRLVMLYKSKRKLCALAEGLIQGAAEHFGEPVEITHSECMHRGAERCRLELKIAARKARRGEAA